MADFYAYYPVPVNSGGGGSGTVTSVGTGTGLTGGPITTSGSVSLIVPVVIANGGTNSTTALNNNRVMKSASGSIVEAAAITAARALISDANGIPTHSVTTATELGYVNGVTSSIQAQLDAKEPTLTPGDISTSTSALTIGNGTASTVGPDVTVDLTTGNLTAAGTDGIAVTGGTGAVVGAGTSIAQHVADSTHNGYLSSTDWSTFNGKQAAGNYITALTGDVTASGPGSAAATVAKIQTTTVTGTTGSGKVVFDTSPTIASPSLTTPALGTPSSGTLTSCTGLPIVAGTTGTLTIARGGTNSTASLNNNRVMQSSGGAIVEAAAITASKALVSDANGIPVASTTSTTQVQYLSAATGTTGTTSTNLVFSTSPTLVTPALGVASATSLTTTGDVTCQGAGVFGTSANANQHSFVGTVDTANGGTVIINNDSTVSTAGALRLQCGVTSGTGRLVTFRDGAGTVQGTITADTTANTTAYNTSSDARLKTHLCDFDGLGLIMAGRPMEYERLSAPGVKEYGFIAQDLMAVLPQAVSPGGADPSLEPWVVDYSKTTAVLWKALQELKQQFDAYVEAHP